MGQSPARRHRLLTVLVVAATFALAKPVWQWSEQRFVHGLLGPGVQVYTCSLLNRSNVARLSQISWTRSVAGPSNIEFACDQIRARYDMSQLLRKRFHFADIQADKVAIRLTRGSTQSTPASDENVAATWRKELRSKLALVLPERLIERSKLVRGANEFVNAWDQQFTTWLERGSQIVEQSKREQTQFQQLSMNPLRSQPEIAVVLSNLQTLKQSMDQADSEIRESEKQVENQRRMLTNLKQADQAEIDKLFAMMPRSIALPFGQSVASEYFSKCWERYAGVCEAVDLTLGQSRFLVVASPVGNDYRPSIAECPLVAVRRASARGAIDLGQLSFPFEAQGKHVDNGAHGSASQSIWRLQVKFASSDVMLAVRDQSFAAQTQREFAMASYSRIATSSPSRSNDPSGKLQPMFEIKCNVEEGQLRGSGMIDLNQWLKDQDRIEDREAIVDSGDIPVVEDASPANYVHVRIGGTWRQPVISMMSDAPDWIAAKLDREYQTAVDQARGQTTKMLDEHHTAALQSVAKLVNTKRSQTLAQFRQLRAQLVLAENVQRELSQRTNQGGFVRRIQVATPVTR